MLTDGIANSPDKIVGGFPDEGFVSQPTKGLEQE
jgi:hypothetical protein